MKWRCAVMVTSLALVCAAGTTARAEANHYLADVLASQTFQTMTSAGVFTCGLSGSSWVPGKISGSSFLPLAAQLKSLKLSSKRASGSKKIKLQKKIQKLKATIANGKTACFAGPPYNPTPSPTPASFGNFDMAGNVTAVGKALFAIPSALNGNIAAGRTFWQAQCAGCHTDKLNRTMPQYRGFIAQSPMLFSEEEVPDEALANLTAYLNRFRQ